MNQRFSLRPRRAVALALSACVLTVAAPTAVAQTTNQDLRSPDARDAAPAAEPAAGKEDLRSPDARDAALASQQAAQPSAGYRDLRSPDVRDAARGITTGSVSAPTPVAVDRRTVVTVEEGSSQTLAIVFSASALMIALLSIGFVAVARRPRPRWTAP
jgi:hypothetical protein